MAIITGARVPPCVDTKVMFTLYRITSARPRKKTGLIELLFTHFTHKNGDFGAISVTERNCAASISKVKSHRLIYRIGVHAISDGFCCGHEYHITHKNGDFGAISVTEQSCPSPISKVKSHISDRCSYYTR